MLNKENKVKISVAYHEYDLTVLKQYHGNNAFLKNGKKHSSQCSTRVKKLLN